MDHSEPGKRTKVYSKEDEAVEIQAVLVVVDRKKLLTDKGYLDELIIKSLGAEDKVNLGRFIIRVEKW